MKARSNSPGFAGVNVYLDGNLLGDVPLFFNNVSQHLALPASFPVDLGPGPHTITLEALTNNTIADTNDIFSLWIID
ncbi:hypothetical protein [Tahibacter soli]|uniref:Uncharacterized protein n=1 Tax=Tahibacter soli TaxID=2983605 RepID=A0A9X4BGP5_9GAMM|nr:hypothetical protein [Tahibacter soli]MDC8011816.1 hypothetical protein [Tahibacter soli]